MYKSNHRRKILKKSIPILIIIVLINVMFTSNSNAQSLIADGELGEFQNASAFSFSKLNVIYVTDISTNEVYKLNLSGIVENFTGGYGWNTGNFDMPVDVFSNTLNVYVTDKNNNRIQIFDRDLNFLSDFKGDRADNSEYHFAYPLSAEVSPLGDLFVLDSDNSRILKYNLSGEFLQVIGNYEAGSFALENPVKLSISDNGNLYVLNQGKIFIFDQFGSGQAKINVIPNAVNINITDNRLCVNSTDEIFALSIGSENKFTKFNPAIEDSIVEAAIIKNKLYVLTTNSIYSYKIID